MALRAFVRRGVPAAVRRLSSNSTLNATAKSTQPENATNRASVPSPDAEPPLPSKSVRHVEQFSRYMLNTYTRPPLVFVGGKGSTLWDMENRRYLDFTAGIAVTSLGHRNPGIEAILDPALRPHLLHVSNLYYNAYTGKLSKLLVETTKSTGGMHDAESVFVCNSGSEANEAAIKFARKVGKVLEPSGVKHEVVSFHGCFHGRTMGSLSATPNPKYQEPFAPMVPGFRYGKLNDIDAINDLVTAETCGVIIEPIQGEGGINVATDEFLTALAKRCREVGAVLVYDEIQCGLGRTGRFWAHSHLPKEAHPDVITTAKALGNGIPIGAAIVNRTVSERMKVGDHGTTFGGNPLACRVAEYVVGQLSDPEMLQDVDEKSAIFLNGFKRLQARFPELIGEVRGRGLILGLQLSEDPAPIVAAALERGLLIITCGTNTLRFVPPLIIHSGQIKQGLQILEESIVATR